MNEVANNIRASVADHLLFDALTDEVQSAIVRLYAAPPAGSGQYTEADLREAYAAGWDECAVRFVDSWFDCPYMSDRDFEEWLKYRPQP